MKAWQKRITSLSLLPFRIEVGAALAAAHGQSREGILEDLLEGEELEDAEIDRGMETQPALVGPDRAVHLDAEPAIDVDLAFVVLPGHAEHDDAFRLDHALEDFRLPILRMPFENEGERFDHLLDRLVKLRFRRVLGFHPRH